MRTRIGMSCWITSLLLSACAVDAASAPELASESEELVSTGYTPCDGSSCGARCTVCDPSDPTCIETAVVKYCQPDDSCSPKKPSCPITAPNPCAYTLCPVGTQCVPKAGEARCIPIDPCATVRCAADTHCEAGQCVPNKVFCGGFAGFPCPGKGSCIDDPTDDCDPGKGGADCGGMCVCKKLGRCPAGSVWDPSPSVCACVPTSPKVFCGGIAGIPCPGKGACVDDPTDDCDPTNGGADCGGLCTCSKTETCPIGSVWNASSSVCACVGVSGQNCGPNTCGAGEYCCNASCGICAPQGGACIQIACNYQ